MRWLIAVIVSLAVAGPAGAGVFKPRDKNRTKRPPAPAVVEKAAPAPTAKKVVAEKAEKPEKPAPVAKAAPAKKAPKSAVATKGRPDDLVPKAKAKPKKDGDVVIVEDKEDDVIVKDDD